MRRYSLFVIGLVVALFLGIVVLAVLGILRANEANNIERATTRLETQVWTTNDATSGTVTTLLAPGTSVIVLQGPETGAISATETTTWYEIEVGDLTGWVWASDIRVE